MTSEWTQDELQAAGEMLYDLAWADEEELFRPKRENWVPRLLAGETPIRTDAVLELACQWNRALADAMNAKMCLSCKDTQMALKYLDATISACKKGGA